MNWVISLTVVAPRRRLALLAVVLLAACSTGPIEKARALASEGLPAEALALLDRHAAEHPDALDAASTRAERSRLLQSAVLQWLSQADRARVGGRLAQARALAEQALSLDADNKRAATLLQDIERGLRQKAAVARAREDARNGRTEAARDILEQVLREAPQLASARTLLNQLAAPASSLTLPPELAASFRKPVTLEFRDAPLRSVFETLSRSHGLNFVFDREVRGDSKVNLSLRDVALDECLNLLLTTEQLARKVLNGNTLLIYPATQVKLREHQDLLTRTIYLTNADVKTAANLVRTIAKTQEVYVDERLNALVVRDSPAVVRLIEDLVASVDLPDAEVMIDVEVLEVTTSKLQAIGLQWAQSATYGVTDSSGIAPATIPIGSSGQILRGLIANPLAVATLRGTDGATNTLANPTIRARNREKAQVMVGDKLPVFTTTSTANVGVSASVNYIDVGIKLDVEPTVQLDNEVTIKVALEVNTLVQAVPGPAGSAAYQIGTRRSTTTLRLADGKTQILAGLVKNEDRKNIDGLPGLSSAPLIGRLFGLHKDQQDKSELVLLMTPRIVRNIPLPDARVTTRSGGTLASPGAEPLRLSAGARAGSSMGTGGAVALSGAGTQATATGAGTPQGEEENLNLELATSGGVGVGGTVSASLINPTDYIVRGEFRYTPELLRDAKAGADSAGSSAFELQPGASAALVLRPLPAAAGQITEIKVSVTGVTTAAGADTPVKVNVTGSGRIEVPRAR
jgi:general secretion pathway protein D